MVLPYKGLIRQNSILSGREHVQGDNDKDDLANSSFSLLHVAESMCEPGVNI